MSLIKGLIFFLLKAISVSFRTLTAPVNTMIDLCQWKVSIGVWNCCKPLCLLGRSTTISSGSSVQPYKNKISYEEQETSFKLKGEGKGRPILLVFIIRLIISLIILSGDVETNPGPTGIYNIHYYSGIFLNNDTFTTDTYCFSK